MSVLIRVLSEHTINQIAAGEVIENPASVMKELVENAIDAGAKKVLVEISGGGLQRISVSDDGNGMGREDAILCTKRHATSKIAKPEDLDTVGTMGFRGEALASIGSIAKLKVQTSTGESVGVEVYVEGDSSVDVKPFARNRGTTVEVCQLFYNVPARRKFQKSAALCSLEVLRVLTQLSLANPKIGFELRDQNKEKLRLPPSDLSCLEALEIRCGNLLGEEFLSEPYKIQGKVGPLTLEGFIASPRNTRPNRTLQTSIVNGRSVNCPALSYAVKDAFGTRIPHDRFPLYVLHLKVPSSMIDVNVHPQKKEVRLREEKWMKDKLRELIQEQVFQTEKPSLSLEAPPPGFLSPKSFVRPSRSEWDEIGFEPSRGILPPSAVSDPGTFFDKEDEQLPLFEEKKVVPIGIYKHFLWINAASSRYLSGDFPEDGVVVVHLKAASSRLLYDALIGQVKDAEQKLLLPLSFSCSRLEAEQFLHHKEALSQMGFSLREIGSQSFLLEALPVGVSESEAADFLRGLFSEETGESWTKKRQRIVARACHRLLESRRENFVMSQALEIFYALMKCRGPELCPLGTKTLYSIETLKLEELFT